MSKLDPNRQKKLLERQKEKQQEEKPA